MYARTTNMRIKARIVIYITNLLLNISIEWNALRYYWFEIKKKLMDRKNWFWKYYVNDSFGIETYIII